MSLILRKNKWLKQTIIKETIEAPLRTNNQYGWTITNSLYKPRNALEKEGWDELVNRLRGLCIHLQELILKKLHGGTLVWCIKHHTLMINSSKLMKYRHWLLVLACLPTLLPRKQIITTHHQIIVQDSKEFNKLNINALVEKWMLCDMLWIQPCLYEKYVMK
jgi:hypothetical protein